MADKNYYSSVIFSAFIGKKDIYLRDKNVRYKLRHPLRMFDIVFFIEILKQPTKTSRYVQKERELLVSLSVFNVCIPNMFFNCLKDIFTIYENCHEIY